MLRPFTEADLRVYAAMNTDPQVMAYLGGPIDPEQSWTQMDGANRSWRDRGYGKIAVARAADGAFLGMCGLSREPWYDDLEIGWRLAPTHWGRGYATEAARAWLAHGFETLKLGRIISIAEPANIRSIAVMKRLGMVLDHRARLNADGDIFDAEIHAITAQAYRARPAPLD